MINESIIKTLGGKECSGLENIMKQINRVQAQIREQRNSYGEIFTVKVSK